MINYFSWSSWRFQAFEFPIKNGTHVSNGKILSLPLFCFPTRTEWRSLRKRPSSVSYTALYIFSLMMSMRFESDQNSTFWDFSPTHQRLLRYWWSAILFSWLSLHKRWNGLEHFPNFSTHFLCFRVALVGDDELPSILNPAPWSALNHASLHCGALGY